MIAFGTSGRNKEQSNTVLQLRNACTVSSISFCFCFVAILSFAGHWRATAKHPSRLMRASIAGGLLLIVPVACLLNGAALTPPMGWLSWQRYRCAIGCDNATGADCFNEKLIRDTADAMVSQGYKAVGYEYVCLGR